MALFRLQSYAPAPLRRAIFRVLEASGMAAGSAYFPALRPGLRILVKPNLLLPRSLACTNPRLCAIVCSWLLDHGVRVTVADSPGFGRAAAIARQIGLEAELRPLGLRVEPLHRPVRIRLKTDFGPMSLPLARKALEADAIVSLPRVKAHAQLRVSLAVKNCFGLVCGLAKALAHARYGESHEKFAACLAALWQALPPVAGVADGVWAMHVTGPSRGRPFPLHLLGASPSAAALDAAIGQALGLTLEQDPLGRALEALPGPGAARQSFSCPLLAPQDFDASGFILPGDLMPASFHPARLALSCFRRLLASARGGWQA